MSPSLLIVSLVLLISSGAACAEPQGCRDCHPQPLTGLHAALACRDCHPASKEQAHRSGVTGARAACLRCHRTEAGILHQPMATRAGERAFIARSFAPHDPEFGQANCSSCHLTSCADCHGSGHDLRRPSSEVCLSCHRGPYVGWDYLGRAPREDSLRYQRGPVAQGEHYLAMRPDIHAERGLECADCHSMASLAAGEKTAKSCRDCHQPNPEVIEHGIAAHMEKLECYACHSAWSAQEYGTFYLRMVDSPARDYFRVRQNPASDYVKSAYLTLRDAPPLGLNARGKVSPLRPFFMYYTNIVEGEPVGRENRLLMAAWQPFFPHTVRRGTVFCDRCHDNPRRFLLEAAERRIYRPDLDGLGINSFWDRSGQQVLGGGFLPTDRVRNLSRKSPDYTRAYVKKWQQFLNHVDASSASASR